VRIDVPQHTELIVNVKDGREENTNHIFVSIEAEYVGIEAVKPEKYTPMDALL
jgi:hypothetical protein